MKNKSINKIIIGLIMLCIFSLGAILGNITKENKVINECKTQAKIDGLWLPDIKELSNYNGKYICINLNGVKDLERLNEVCNHEIGHEIFATYCENNITKCIEVTK